MADQSSGLIALVTGASSGIGAAIARGLAAKGATIAVNYRQNREGAEKVRRVGATLGLDVAINHIENPRRELEQHFYHPDHQRLRDLGYRPTHDVEAEMAIMLKDLMTHRRRIEERSDVLVPDIAASVGDRSQEGAVLLDPAERAHGIPQPIRPGIGHGPGSRHRPGSKEHRESRRHRVLRRREDRQACPARAGRLARRSPAGNNACCRAASNGVGSTQRDEG